MTNSKFSVEEIFELVQEHTGCDLNELTIDVDIINGLGCCGDDLDDLMAEYSKRFDVDLQNYLWYFHSEEEGSSNSIGNIFFKSPDRRVQHISITPGLLLESANAGQWLLNYPEHSLPKGRYDILINQILLIAFVIFLVYKCAK